MFSSRGKKALASRLKKAYDYSKELTR